MKKVILVGLLLVFAWTSVVGAQEPESGTESQNPFMEFLFEVPWTTDKLYATSVNGHDWVAWTQTLKVAYVEGFITAAGLVSTYSSDALFSCPIDASTSTLLTLVWYWRLVEGLAAAGGLRFRIGVYVLELDVLYEDERNRIIPLMEAIYIANERLNGRDVDLPTWRTKALEQEGA